MKRRNTLYFSAASITFIIGLMVAGILVLHPRTFKVVSRDGTAGPGSGPSGKGIGISVTSWVSSDGMSVEEASVIYSSIEDARRDFELESSQAERIPGQYPASNNTRVLGKYGSSFKLVTLEQKTLRYVEASSLDAVLAFEASWLKFEWW